MEILSTYDEKPVHGRRQRAGLMAACLCAVLAACLGPLRAQTANEYDLKAAFLYKFASFVEWPAEFANAPVCIGIVGHDPFGDRLEQVVKGRTINGRGFVVRRFRAEDGWTACQIVFISSSERKGLQAILERAHGGSVLTVGDTPGFCEQGGLVNIAVAGDKVRLEINVEGAEKSRLQVSSKLLSLAKIVRGAVQ